MSQSNLKHLHQSSSTSIGHGDGYNLFHRPERHETANSVLDGTLEWEYPVSEVNEFITNMRIAHDLTALKEETEKINTNVMHSKKKQTKLTPT